MAKMSGVGMTALMLDNAAGTPVDVRNDVTNWDFAMPRAVQDVTGVDKFAIERILLLGDFSINYNGVFNPATGAIHDVLKTVPSTDAVRTASLEIGGQTLAAEILLTDYAVTRGNDGALTWTSPGVLANGVPPVWDVA